MFELQGENKSFQMVNQQIALPFTRQKSQDCKISQKYNQICQTCQKAFENSLQLLIHIQNIHLNKSSYFQSADCNLQFNAQQLQYQQIKQNAQQQQIQQKMEQTLESLVNQKLGQQNQINLSKLEGPYSENQINKNVSSIQKIHNYDNFSNSQEDSATINLNNNYKKNTSLHCDNNKTKTKNTNNNVTSPNLNPFKIFNQSNSIDYITDNTMNMDDHTQNYKKNFLGVQKKIKKQQSSANNKNECVNINIIDNKNINNDNKNNIDNNNSCNDDQINHKQKNTSIISQIQCSLIHSKAQKKLYQKLYKSKKSKQTAFRILDSKTLNSSYKVHTQPSLASQLSDFLKQDKQL